VPNKIKSSPWLIAFQVMFALFVGLVLRGSDPFHFFLTKLYPPEDSVGSIGIDMSDISGVTPLGAHAYIFLIQHEFEDKQTVTLMRHPQGGSIQHILAGVSARIGSAALPTGSLNKSSFLEVTLPPRVLVAVNVITPPGAETESYSISSTKFEKKVKNPEDLEIVTANEARNVRILYWLSLLTIFFVGLGVSRFPKLAQLTEEDA